MPNESYQQDLIRRVQSLNATSIGKQTGRKSTENLHQMKENARKSNFTIGMGKNQPLKSISKSAFEMNRDSKMVPHKNSNKEDSRAAHWNLGH